MRRAAPLFLTAGVMFAIRWWISGGLGGYPRALPPASSAKALSVRLWVIPLFPLNWSRPLSFGVAIALAGLLSALLIFRSKRPSLWFVAMTIAAVLPAVQQLLIGDDLQKSRLFYLTFQRSDSAG